MEKCHFVITFTSFKLLRILSRRTALAILSTLGSKAEKEPTNDYVQSVKIHLLCVFYRIKKIINFYSNLLTFVRSPVQGVHFGKCTALYVHYF